MVFILGEWPGHPGDPPLWEGEERTFQSILVYSSPFSCFCQGWWSLYNGVQPPFPVGLHIASWSTLTGLFPLKCPSWGHLCSWLSEWLPPLLLQVGAKFPVLSLPRGRATPSVLSASYPRTLGRFCGFFLWEVWEDSVVTSKLCSGGKEIQNSFLFPKTLRRLLAAWCAHLNKTGRMTPWRCPRPLPACCVPSAESVDDRFQTTQL